MESVQCISILSKVRITEISEQLSRVDQSDYIVIYNYNFWSVQCFICLSEIK